MRPYILFALFSICGRGSDADIQDVVRRAATVMQADWATAPSCAFVQRHLTTSKGITTRKTHQVFMIEGSDYYMPIAIDAQPLPADQQTAELQRLKEEVARRSREALQEARQRSEQYRKTREQNGILLREFTGAFDFTFSEQETVDGHVCYVLDAMPRASYRRPTEQQGFSLV